MRMIRGVIKSDVAADTDLGLAFKELRAEIKKFKNDIIKSVASMLCLQFIVVIGAFAALFHLYR